MDITIPFAPGRPGILYRPIFSASRKGLRRQDFSCKFQSLRNGDGGKYNAPGLPGIAGTFTGGSPENGDHASSGAFQSTGQAGHAGLQGGSTARGVISFVPSLSSPIYAASNTVMPASVDIKMVIYLGQTSQV